jgi:hypothetical protein
MIVPADGEVVADTSSLVCTCHRPGTAQAAQRGSRHPVHRLLDAALAAKEARLVDEIAPVAAWLAERGCE